MDKKKIIKTVIFTVVIICSLSIQACVGYNLYIILTDPPIGHTVSRDVDEYMKVNKYVNEHLEKYYSGSLPEKSVVENNDTEYFYEYFLPGLLGDPNFIIYVKTEIKDDNDFSAEKERIENLSDNKITLEDGNTLYDVNGFARNSKFVLMSYKDDEIHSGMSFYFEMVIISDEENTIEYLNALAWDYARDFEYDIIPKFVFPLQEYYSEESA